MNNLSIIKNISKPSIVKLMLSSNNYNKNNLVKYNFDYRNDDVIEVCRR
jgi:hypothetical protein